MNIKTVMEAMVAIKSWGAVKGTMYRVEDYRMSQKDDQNTPSSIHCIKLVVLATKSWNSKSINGPAKQEVIPQVGNNRGNIK